MGPMSLDGLAFARRQRHVSCGICTVENHTRITRAKHAKKVGHQGTFVRSAVRSQRMLAKRISGVDARGSGFSPYFAMGNTRDSRLPSRRAPVSNSARRREL
jgi:hypothetical protein